LRREFPEGRRWIDQHDRAGAGVHQADGFAHDQLQRLLRIERGVDDVAHLIEQLQPLVARHQFWKFVTHNFFEK